MNAATPDVKRTVVVYDPRWDRSAKSLAAALPGSELRAVPGLGATLKVIAGTDFERVRKVRAEDPGRASPGWWCGGTRWRARRRAGGGRSRRSRRGVLRQSSNPSAARFSRSSMIARRRARRWVRRIWASW
ncbi:hypothetical protein GCM10011428_43330 [Streptomyces violaceus]